MYGKQHARTLNAKVKYNTCIYLYMYKNISIYIFEEQVVLLCKMEWVKFSFWFIRQMNKRYRCLCVRGVYINNFSTSQARCYTEPKENHRTMFAGESSTCYACIYVYIHIRDKTVQTPCIHFSPTKSNRISVFFVAHYLSALFHSFILLSFPLSFICSVLKMFHAIMCNIYANVYLYALNDYPLSILKNDGPYYANDRRAQFFVGIPISFCFCFFFCCFTEYIPSTSK